MSLPEEDERRAVNLTILHWAIREFKPTYGGSSDIFKEKNRGRSERTVVEIKKKKKRTELVRIMNQLFIRRRERKGHKEMGCVVGRCE